MQPTSSRWFCSSPNEPSEIFRSLGILISKCIVTSGYSNLAQIYLADYVWFTCTISVHLELDSGLFVCCLLKNPHTIPLVRNLE